MRSAAMNEPRIIVAVGTVVFRGDSVLLVRRAKPPMLGQWTIPGGRLEPGESIAAATLREVAEETAVSARLCGLIGVFEAFPETPGAPHYVLIDHWAEWTAGEPRAGDDATAAEFAPYDDALSRLSWDETRRALAMALALRSAP
jgi:8-oxo-dGTP diphosphatase